MNGTALHPSWHACKPKVKFVIVCRQTLPRVTYPRVSIIHDTIKTKELQLNLLLHNHDSIITDLEAVCIPAAIAPVQTGSADAING